jgi:hypothetical protein
MIRKMVLLREAVVGTEAEPKQLLVGRMTGSSKSMMTATRIGGIR